MVAYGGGPEMGRRPVAALLRISTLWEKHKSYGLLWTVRVVCLHGRRVATCR